MTDYGPTAGTVDPVIERFWEAAKRIPSYLRLGGGMAVDGRVPTEAKLSIALGGLYAVSPIDLVPGIIPVAGQLDDLMVLLVTLRRAVRACPPELAAEHLDRAGLTAADFDDDLAACRATVRWVAVRGARMGGRLASAAGRRMWSWMSSVR